MKNTYQAILWIVALAFFFSSINCSAQATSKALNASFPNKTPDYILFGTYFGECVGQCAIMYRYDLKSNSNVLFIDSTDSFFKRKNSIICRSRFASATNAKTIRKLATSIPYRLINTSKMIDRFGCPDCTDGGGIYVEFSQQSLIRKYYIDYDTRDLPADIRIFAESVLTTIEQIKKSRDKGDK